MSDAPNADERAALEQAAWREVELRYLPYREWRTVDGRQALNERNATRLARQLIAEEGPVWPSAEKIAKGVEALSHAEPGAVVRVEVGDGGRQHVRRSDEGNRVPGASGGDSSDRADRESTNVTGHGLTHEQAAEMEAMGWTWCEEDGVWGRGDAAPNEEIANHTARELLDGREAARRIEELRKSDAALQRVVAAILTMRAHLKLCSLADACLEEIDDAIKPEDLRGEET